MAKTYKIDEFIKLDQPIHEFEYGWATECVDGYIIKHIVGHFKRMD